MERLSDQAIEIINELHTERLDYSSEYIPLIDAANRLAAYEDTGLEPEEFKKAFNEGALLKLTAQHLGTTPDRLHEWAKAEQEGRLVVLPCKVGDPVWLLKTKCKYAGEKNKPWDCCDQYWTNVYRNNMWGCAGKAEDGGIIRCVKREMEWYAHPFEYSLVLYAPDIVLGKNLFLTREEAEAALEGASE